MGHCLQSNLPCRVGVRITGGGEYLALSSLEDGEDINVKSYLPYKVYKTVG